MEYDDYNQEMEYELNFDEEDILKEIYEEKEKTEKLYLQHLDIFRKETLSDMTDEEYDEIFDDEFSPDSFDYIAHIGYGTVELLENYHNCFYPNHRFFTFNHIDFDESISEEECKRYQCIMGLPFMEQDIYDTELKELVYQRTGCVEDEYYGFIAEPMKDGRWWICEYHI